MKLLLDTHIILWALDDNPKLSSQARKLIVDAGNDILLQFCVYLGDNDQIYGEAG